MSQYRGLVILWDDGDCLQVRWSVTDKAQPDSSLYQTQRGLERFDPQQDSDFGAWLQNGLVSLVGALEEV